MTDRPLRVALVCREYPPEVVGGGIGTYTANLARALAAGGHRISVVAHAPAGEETRRVEDGVTVYGVPSRRPALWVRATGRRHGATAVDAYLRARAVARKVREIAAHQGLDVLQSPEHGAEGYLLARDGPGIPHVVRFHTPLFLVNEAAGSRLSLGARAVDAMERTTARGATLHTCASRALAGIVARRFGLGWERVRVVPNAIDHRTFVPAPTPAGRPPTVLYVGKIAPLKGARVLAEAIPRILRRVPEVRFTLVGSDHQAAGGGSTREQMLAVLRERGAQDRVLFRAPVPRPALVQLYQDADVCVLPTLWDNFPNTCLEAMACGVPVVASRVGGLPEIIDDGDCGVLVPPNDAVQLAEAIAGLLEDPSRRVEMGRAARRKIIDVFSPERLVRATVAVYEEAIARGARPAQAG